METVSAGFPAIINPEKAAYPTQINQQLLELWCAANDHLKPVFIDRNSINPAKILVHDGTNYLIHIPEDIKLYELPKYFDALSNLTNTQYPAKTINTSSSASELGQLLQDTGVYLTSRLGKINQGTYIAQDLARKFYDFGYALQTGEYKSTPMDQILEKTLSPERTRQIDKFLAGDALYSSRVKNLPQLHPLSPQTEKIRLKTLNQFFRVAEKALEPRTHLQPLPSSQNSFIDSAFTDKVDTNLDQVLNTPKREYEQAILDRGLAKLLTDLKSPNSKFIIENINKLLAMFGIDIKIERQPLIESLDLSNMKRQLAEAHQTGNIDFISKIELAAAAKIQIQINKLEYEYNRSQPKDILETEQLNCAGKADLASAFLSKLKIPHSILLRPEHVGILIVTDNQKIYYMDPTNHSRSLITVDKTNTSFIDSSGNLVLHHKVASNIKSQRKYHFFMRPADNNPYNSFFSSRYTDQAEIVDPERGRVVSILDIINYYAYFDSAPLEQPLKNIAITNLSLTFLPENIISLNNLAKSYASLNTAPNREKAIKILHRALVLDPHNILVLTGIGSLIGYNNQTDEAEDYFKTAIKNYPQDEFSYLEYAKYFYQNGLYSEANNILQQTKARIHNLSSEFYLIYAEILLKQRLFPQAEAQLKTSLKLRPQNITAQIVMSELLQEKQQYQAALNYLLQIDQSKYPAPGLFYNLGRSYYYLQDYNQALRNFDQAILHFPTYPPPYYGKAIIDLSSGNTESAKNCLIKYIETASQKSLKNSEWIHKAEAVLQSL